MEALTNGHKITESTAQELLTVDSAKKRCLPRHTQNKQVSICLDLDTGSSRAKFVIDGWSGSYPSIFKQVSGELPSGIAGCFSIGNKNYAVGRVTSSLNGEVVEAFKDNKIKYLHIWLIVITYFRRGTGHLSKPISLFPVVLASFIFWIWAVEL